MEKFLLFAVLAVIAWYWLKPRRRKRAFAPMFDEAEARAILGVDAGADEQAIRAAHRRLVAAVHPDRGGSVELTRRINAARDMLLQQRRD